ncbi:HEAT repeat domain-containing protein [Cellulomonas fimi]|uniref:HEAT repeat domain-containing protein n=1 Tax=Cellulomonas fimi TaxID=1708 RepID=UPI00235946A7|nr:HEAT repeat domain-containing protein [Cellulomonas fimi]
MGSSSDVPIESAFAAALDERRRNTDEGPLPHLLELQRRATEEVFVFALRWTTSKDPEERELGIDVVRELGPADTDGRRPFSDRAIPHLLAMLRAEDDPVIERRLLQAVAFNGATEALGEFLDRADHPDDGVRRTIAFLLPGLTDADAPDPDALDALARLTRDVDADVRYYSLYALVAEEGFTVDVTRAVGAARRLVDDPDPQVRDLARAHSGERVLTPFGPLALSLTTGSAALGVPTARSVLTSGARSARWEVAGGLTVETLVVPYAYENALLEHPRCSCWGVEWRLHATSDTAPITIAAHLPDSVAGSRGGGWHLATVEFENDNYHLAIGGPADDALDDELEAGLHAPSWRGQFASDAARAEVARQAPHGLTWHLPRLLAGESATTHVAVAWTVAGPAEAGDATAWAVDITRTRLREHAGIPTGSTQHSRHRRGPAPRRSQSAPDADPVVTSSASDDVPGSSAQLERGDRA